MNRLSNEIQKTQNPDTLFYLGSRHQIQNELQEAISCYQRAVQLKPDFAEAYYNMGNAYQDLKMTDQAINAYRTSLALEPDNINAYNNLGIILQELGELSQAIQCYEKALSIRPNSARIYYNLARIYRDQDNLNKAILFYRKALGVQPNYAKAYNALGTVFQDQAEFNHSIACFQEALKIKSDYPEAFFNMGVSFQKLGSLKDALSCHARALEINPDFPYALWYFHLSLPAVYETSDCIFNYRNRFMKGLEQIIRHFHLNDPDQRKAALDGVGSMTNFYLPYQGLNDLELQKKYGQYVCDVMQANYPHWVQPLTMPPVKQKEKIRIGYVSAYMASHTVGKLLLGWVENADRNNFEIFCYHINKPSDQVTNQFKRQSDHFFHIHGELEETARQILSDNLHVLVFSDIGMYPLATQLAGLRLAPVQCVGWGHPVTTGLATIDYYLSSDLMEPEYAQQYYCEKLIRLPNISLAYREPTLPQNPKTRNELGLREEGVVYLCPQSLFKYLPQHDYIFPSIAQKVSDAQFVFIVNVGALVYRKFKVRLTAAFREYQLNFEEYCLFQPKLGHRDYLSLNLACDILLDSLDWSGGHTTLEAVRCGLPVVTLPGKFMRGRHTMAMLKMVGITETIAGDEDDYVAIAAKLGLDRNWYSSVKLRLQANHHKLYNDMTCIRALEDFYRSVISTKSN